MFEGLDEKFDMTTEIVHQPIQSLVSDNIAEDTLDQDVALARTHIKHALDVAQDAVKDLANIAKTAESARAFEVLGQLIKTVSDTSKDLVALQKTKQETRRKAGKVDGEKTVHNNVFVGSTHELMQLLKGKKDE